MGFPKGHFGCSRGLRQGDPLSPLLFLLVAEVLDTLIGRATEVGMFEPSFVRSRVGPVSHLQFANDTLIFCDNSQRQIRLLRCVFGCFEAVSGFRINLNKSSLIAVGDVPNLDQLATDLGCKMGSLLSSYLGLPLGAKYKKEILNLEIDRMRKRLNGWKARYSKGGKLTLIKASLASIPIHFLSLLLIPSSVCKEIERIQRDFL